MPLQIIIVVALAVGATFFVVVVAIGLLINKYVEVRQSKSTKRLYEFYSALFADLLLQTVEVPTAGRKRRVVYDEYEALLAPVKDGLSWSSPVTRGLHRNVIRSVLIDFARDLTGESMERLQYFFFSLEFVQDEMELLQSRKWWIRAKAARDLGLLRARKAAAALALALEDEHPDVRNEAMQSLVKLTGVEALRTILKTARSINQWTALELSLIVKGSQEEAFPFLVEALDYPDQSVVLFSLEMLAETGFVTAVDPLLRVVNTYPNIVIRAKAVEALGRLGDQRAEPLLYELLRNPYPVLRSSATKALERIGSPAAVPLLAERMRTGSVAERLSAARALARSGEAGLTELKRAAEHDEEHSAGIARHVLEEVEGVVAS